MKKSILIVSLLIVVLLISGCSFSKTATISEAKLTDRETTLLEITSDHSFVYDYTLHNEYKEIAVWLEKYEKGTLVEDMIFELAGEVEDKGSIIFTADKGTDDQMGFRIGFSAGENHSSGSGGDQLNILTDELSSVWVSFVEGKKQIDNEMTLATLIYSKADGGIRVPFTNFDENMDDKIQELADYDVVYLLKSEFIK